MSTVVLTTNRFELDSIADSALKTAVRFWLIVVVIGQLLFALTVASIYGLAVARGNLLGWNKFMTVGYVPGDGLGL